jgi:hypothetical protein
LADEKADSMVGKKDVMVVDQRVGVLVEKLVGTSAEQWGGETEEMVVDDWVDETVEMMGAQIAVPQAMRWVAEMAAM